jgi:hypothetical protein
MRIVINIRVKPFKCQLKAFISVLYEYKKKMKKLTAQLFEFIIHF